MPIALTLILFSWSGKVLAENALLDRLLFESRQGAFCAQLEKDKLSCLGHRSAAPTAPAYDLLKAAAFDRAADRQVGVDTCLAETTRNLRASPAALQRWRGIIGQAWLGQRKAGLMLAFCKSNFNDLISPQTIEDLGPDGAFEKLAELNRFLGQKNKKAPAATEARVKALEPWKDICFEPAMMKALGEARQLFVSVIPNLASPDLFKDVDEHRAVFVNKTTGKPLTDQELLAANLTDLKFLRMQASPALNEKLVHRLEEMADARTETARALRQARVGEGQYLLSENQRQYIFDDGTLTDVLRESLDEKTAPIAAGCLAQHYTRSMAGELSKLALGTLLGGGGYAAVFRGAKTFRALSSLGKVRRSAMAGMGIQGTVQSAGRLLSACKAGKFNHDGSTKARVDLAVGSDLPEEVNFQPYSQELAHAAGSACADKGVENTVLRMTTDANCLHALLWEGLPLAVGLPGGF